MKDYREKELKSYVIGNILVTLLVTGFLKYDPSAGNTAVFETLEKLLESAILSSVLYIYVFILDSVLPGDMKLAVCYFGLKNMPGFTIFSDVDQGRKKALDGRYTAESVRRKYAELYTALAAETDENKKKELQNSRWYSIYQSHKDEPSIYTAHKDFLLCRDTCIMTLWLLVGYLGTWALSLVPFSWKLITFFVVEFAITCIAVHSKGGRFARNVLAVDISSDNEE